MEGILGSSAELIVHQRVCLEKEKIVLREELCGEWLDKLGRLLQKMRNDGHADQNEVRRTRFLYNKKPWLWCSV